VTTQNVFSSVMSYVWVSECSQPAFCTPHSSSFKEVQVFSQLHVSAYSGDHQVFLRKSISALQDLCSYVTMMRSHHLWYLLLLLLLRDVAVCVWGVLWCGYALAWGAKLTYEYMCIVAAALCGFPAYCLSFIDVYRWWPLTMASVERRKDIRILFRM